MIAFTSEIADVLASVIIDELPSSSLIKLGRSRVNRVATLDGLSVLDDQGFTYSDNTIKIKTSTISKAEVLKLERMVSLYPTTIYYEEKGVFKGAISDINARKFPVTITFLITEKLS